MKQAICIATTPKSYVWLNDLLKSINGFDRYPIVILSDYTFEIGKLRFMLDHTDYDEFLLLQDSLVVKDVGFFDLVFREYQGATVAVDPQMRSYLVKYRREILNKLPLPAVATKMDSVVAEADFPNAYLTWETNYKTLTDGFSRSEVFETRHGRENMVLECQWLIKYKSIWNRHMVR